MQAREITVDDVVAAIGAEHKEVPAGNLSTDQKEWNLRVMGEAQSLVHALRKLSEKNLSNLIPHPLYSGFYYSHPTLLERERALRTAA